MTTLLLVDDEPGMLETLDEILTAAGYAVTAVNDSERALNEIRSGGYDLVLMDIRMPDMNGTEAVRKLKQDERTAAIHVVALTSSTMKGDRERFLADGFDGYLEKPIRVREFPDQVRSHLA